MTQAVRKVVRVKLDGVIEIRSSEFKAGEVAEVIVLTESAARTGADLAQELDALLKRTQALSQARAITDAEIAAEIAAYRISNA